MTVMLSALVVLCTGLLESLTRAVKLEVPAMIGVPAMTPFELRLKPVGRDPDPETIVQFKGAVPPVAVSVAE